MIAAVLTCLGGRGTGHTESLWSYLTPELGEIVRAETTAWIKRLRHVSYDGRSMRERFTYRHDSLWWFTELFLYKTRRLETALATLVALDAARDQHAPAGFVIDTDSLVVRDAAHLFGRTHRVPVDTRGRRGDRERHARTSYLTGLTSTLSSARPRAPVFLPGTTSIAAFVQTSFAGPAMPKAGRPSSFVPQVLDALAGRLGPDTLLCIGIGPRRNLRRRRGHAMISAGDGLPVTPIERLVPHGQLGGALELWRRRAELAQQITTGESVRAAGRVREYDLWTVLNRELEAVALHQWPWSARAMDETAAALGAIKPELVLTYAEASAWGRAVILESRRRQIRSVAIPHELAETDSFIFSHEPDEISAAGSDAGFPAPDRVLVFDERTATRLDEVGHLPLARIAITGHPRSDELRMKRLVRLTVAERAELRRALDVPSERRLAVLVARPGELGPLMEAILDAAVRLPQVHLAIRAHPGDAPSILQTLIASAANISLVPESIDPARLLAGSDGLITRESAVAVDALAVGVPSLIVGTPDHLAPLVDAGIMLGAAAPEDVGPAFEALLYDDRVRKRLSRVVGAHSAGHDRAGARAADRAADVILELRHHT
jgi:hypothetical protein